MLDNLEFTARIRPRSVNAMGDDLPDDLHHDYTVEFNAHNEFFELTALNDQNKVKCIPLTLSDLERINAAVEKFNRMKAEAQNA